jgi:L-asparaginase
LNRKPLVCIVGTGGTIASKFDPEIGGHVSAASAQDLVAAVPALADMAALRVVEHSNVNSALMDSMTAFALSTTLADVLRDEAVAGAVVTHGTATLEETAYLMDLTLATDKPVVVTGAQRNFDANDADGPRNLLQAVMIAADPQARGRGVLTAMGGEIHAARDSTKANPQDLIAFVSRDGGPVGVATEYGVTFFARPERRVHLPVDHIKTNVQLIRFAQGSSDLLVRACVRERVDGIVVEATGAGNINLPYYKAMCEAMDAGIPVVVATRCPSGAPHPGKGYDGSFQSLIRHGALSAGYLSGLKARILLMVALAHTTERGRLQEIFTHAGGG